MCNFKKWLTSPTYFRDRTSYNQGSNRHNMGNELKIFRQPYGLNVVGSLGINLKKAQLKKATTPPHISNKEYLYKVLLETIAIETESIQLIFSPEENYLHSVFSFYIDKYFSSVCTAFFCKHLYFLHRSALAHLFYGSFQCLRR